MSPLTHRVSRSTWYLLAMIYVSIIAVVVVSIWYTSYTVDQNNRKLCGVLRVFHEGPTSNSQIRMQLDKLYVEFHCADVAKP